MLLVEEYVETKTKHERQVYIRLDEECYERGGNSTNHKGVLAQYLNSNIPYGSKYLLCHACNNDKCSNPRHLYWGTPKENVEDSINAGTRYSPPKGKSPFMMCEEVKTKISQTLKGRPSNNKLGVNGFDTGKSQRGYTYKRKYKQMWITDGMNNTRIKDGDDIPDGWYKGRTI